MALARLVAKARYCTSTLYTRLCTYNSVITQTPHCLRSQTLLFVPWGSSLPGGSWWPSIIHVHQAYNRIYTFHDSAKNKVCAHVSDRTHAAYSWGVIAHFLLRLNWYRPGFPRAPIKDHPQTLFLHTPDAPTQLQHARLQHATGQLQIGHNSAGNVAQTVQSSGQTLSVYKGRWIHGIAQSIQVLGKPSRKRMQANLPKITPQSVLHPL